MSDNTISSRIDELLSKDITSLSPTQIVNIITGGEPLPEYIDLQSEEGFNRELEKTDKEVQDVIKSLEPQDLPIPLEKIEELSCNLDGDELYSAVLLESIKLKDKDLYNELINSSEYKLSQNIEIKDIGISSNISSLNKKPKIKPSKGITNFMDKKNPDLLRGINEPLFDHIDPLLFGKPTNAGSRKRRELNILGFKVPLEFIMSKGKILHVKILGPDLTIDQAKERVKKSASIQKKNTKPCDSMEDDTTEGNSVGPENQNKKIVGGVGPIEGKDITDYSSFENSGLNLDENFFQGEDPAIDLDCAPDVPEDPITGDPIVTIENFDAIANEFCDPPEIDLSNLQIDDGIGPEPTGPDFSDESIKSIQGCLDSALEKQESIDKKTNDLARWKNIERFLEEIYFHYEIIFEYQRTLYQTWTSRRKDINTKSGFTTSIGIAIQILTIKDQITEIQKQIRFSEESLDNYKKIFLSNNHIFTDNLFLLNLPDTELDLEGIISLFEKQINADLSPIVFDDINKEWPKSQGINAFFEKIDDIRNIILRKNEISVLNQNIIELVDLKDQYTDSLLKSLNRPSLSENDLENAFKSSAGWIPSTGSSSELDYARDVFEQPSNQSNINVNPYIGYGYDFKQNLKKFSVRFTSSQFDYNEAELKIKLELFTDLGNQLPYKDKQKPSKLSITGTPAPFFKTVSEPNIEKIKIGNEYAGNGGFLVNNAKDYLNGNKFLTIKNIKDGQNDVAQFYDFLNDVISSDKSKENIIDDIKEKRGILYAKLIEKSSSPWLFFTSEERGDNDARNPVNLRPSSFNADGEPTPAFVDFWSNFKTKWTEKYQKTKTQDIIPEVNKMKEYAKKAGLGLGNTISTSDIRGIRIIENYFDLKKKIDQIEELLLITAEKSKELEESLTSENVQKEFSSLKCSVGSSNIKDQNNVSVVNCPPKCCGPAGSDFKTENYLLSSPPSSDCPLIFSKCWMDQFCKDLTLIGLLPYPSGLAPIENSSFFLSGGPSVRLGFKYWPVGYLPPSFIPIPIANPIDGQPYIRVPLPMIWTIIPPIVIPLPLNLGTLIIFIPFIGGFMPTPLFFIKENIGGASFFLSGLRGPRFIPRKSDPKINDPLEKIKQSISFGFPDKLLSLPGFGSDNQDSPARILENLQANLVKILDGVPAPGNLDSLRNLQQKEANIKSTIEAKNKDYNKKYALLDVQKPNIDSENNQLRNVISERKSVLIDLISNYLEKGIPNPKSIYYPKDKDSLKVDTPGIVKSQRDIKDNLSNLSPVIPSPTINIKDKLKDALKNISIPTPSEYDADNKNVSTPNKIILKVQKDPRAMTSEEFKDFTSKVRKSASELVKRMVSGNGTSIIEDKKKGAFSSLDLTKFQGTFTFPPADILDPAPNALKFDSIPNPSISGISDILTQGISSVPFDPKDFSKYVRSDSEGPVVIIRIKDLKKIVSSKLGLSRKKVNDSERPIDKIDPLLQKFPFPDAPLTSELTMSNSFGSAISLFEMPTSFPAKQDQISQTPGIGGIPQVTIPGTVTKNYIVKTIENGMKNSGLLEKHFPEINDINSPKFINLEPQDIQKIVRSMIADTLDPASPSIPDFLKVTNTPILPKARPTDILEQTLIGMGVPPPTRIVYSLFWKYFKGVNKSPLPEAVTQPMINASGKILPKIPWPITVLLGRSIINIINPICLSDDHPSWRRMSLKNVYYVVYMDEFLRSAADVSGLFKFFFGDPVYPASEFSSELTKKFTVKKY